MKSFLRRNPYWIMKIIKFRLLVLQTFKRVVETNPFSLDNMFNMFFGFIAKRLQSGFS